jgi:hypothetical protein
VDFVVFVVVFAVFIAGLTLAIQGFVGREIYPEGTPFAVAPDLDRPGIAHPRERHPVRLFLIGVALMILAVVLGIMLF